MYLCVSNVSQTPCLTISPLPHVSQVSYIFPCPMSFPSPRLTVRYACPCLNMSPVSHMSLAFPCLPCPTILLMHPYLPESLFTVNSPFPMFPSASCHHAFESPVSPYVSLCLSLFHLSPRGRSPADTSRTMFTTSDTSDTSDTGPDILLTFRRHCPHRDSVGRVPPLAVN